ncbi:hypothetical protein D9Q98_004682 [Chlorella vulgaris]|uniref:Uncharacterized protein n=1 Tax=Chlorella vulgaris TaxID=3077 RepID=A0A9D4TQA3_CHLVU|nr:hypothetical protein D9Q98_004682 [Chlorella vulgaris]
MAALCAAARVSALRNAVCGRPSHRGRPQPLRQRAGRVQAAAPSEGNSSDLSAEFADFKRRMKAGIPEVEARTATAEAPRFSATRSGDWNAGPSADSIRKQEMQMLNAVTNANMMQIAAGGAMALVLVLLLAAGGPPADPRCTLPWC